MATPTIDEARYSVALAHPDWTSARVEDAARSVIRKLEIGALQDKLAADVEAQGGWGESPAQRWERERFEQDMADAEARKAEAAEGAEADKQATAEFWRRNR
jgi:hypothetical protein